MIRVAVFGAAGKMGLEVCRAVDADPELALVAAIDPGRAGERLGPLAAIGSDLVIAAGPGELAAASAQVAIDFTVLEAALANARACAEHGVHDVIGTSGFGTHELDELRRLFARSNCLVAPNFAIGAVLMMRFAELAAPHFETAEIIELHHDRKVDAPSGTAMATVERMAAASDDWAADPTERETLRGARGASGPAGIPVHSVRLRGLVAHQEVLLGTTGQSLTLRHDSYDRTSFMPGVVLAARRIADHPGVTVGLEAFLGL